MSDKPTSDAAARAEADMFRQAQTGTYNVINGLAVARGIAVATCPETVGPVPRAPGGAIPDTIIMPRELPRVMADRRGNGVRVWKNDGEPRSPVPYIRERTVSVDPAFDHYTVVDMACLHREPQI